MRILYHHRIRSKDGQYVHLEELVHALEELGHEVILVGPRAVESSRFGSDAGIVALLKRTLPRHAYEFLEFVYAFGAYLRLRKAVRQHRPDCLYERYNLFLPSGVWIKRRFGLPMLLEVNSPLLDERRQYGGLALVKLARWSERFAWREADRVLPVTEVLADRIRKEGVSESNIVVIPNGVDLARFNPTDRDRAKRQFGVQGRLVLGFTGFLREWHGLDRVVEFIADRRRDLSCHLMIVGEGPARSALEKLARERCVQDRFTFTGVVDRHRVADYVAAFDVALQPAVVSYASPLKLFEYMAMGCAIVAPASPNIQEILTDQENALLFTPGDTQAFADAVEKVCQNSQLRKSIGQRAMDTIVTRGFTWENNARRVAELFSQLLHREVPALETPESMEGATTSHRFDR